MYWRTLLIGRNRRLVAGVAALAIAGTAFAVGTGLSSASTSRCGGLEASRQQALDFMAEQRANPDAQSEARIANRQAVVDLIDVQLREAGCAGGGPVAQPPAAAPEDQDPDEGTDETAEIPEEPGDPDAGADGDVVCPGSTVTLSGEAGSPAASSGTLPIGTVLRVTNLDNDKSMTVEVTSTSGSCILLNDAAFEEVREPGKFLIRRAVIERIG